ncbi:MAG: hypothetical protein Q8K02_08975 [Flavobacterium sp.]|nr:hypothetical protein [Flavobacterium sp.]
MNKHEFEELQKKFAQDTKKRKFLKLFNFFTTLISVIGITVISYYFVTMIFKSNDSQKIEIEKQNVELKKRIDDLEKKHRIKDTSFIVATPTGIKIEELEKKIQILNNLIIESPERSLSIPLLNKDIDYIKKENSLQIELIKDKVETVVDLNKWILGLIFSLLITIVLSNLSKSKVKNSSEE